MLAVGRRGCRYRILQCVGSNRFNVAKASVAQRVRRPLETLRPVQSLGRSSDRLVENVPVQVGEERLTVLDSPSGCIEVHDERILYKTFVGFLSRVLGVHTLVPSNGERVHPIAFKRNGEIASSQVQELAQTKPAVEHKVNRP